MTPDEIRVSLGLAEREDWFAILFMWMNECTEVDQYRRLHTVLQRCIYDGTPLEYSAESLLHGRFPKYP